MAAQQGIAAQACPGRTARRHNSHVVLVLVVHNQVLQADQEPQRVVLWQGWWVKGWWGQLGVD